jgi:hypothetical protein
MIEGGSINLKVLMNTQHLTRRKEVTALDADVPLLRPSLIRFNSSELRLLQSQVDRPDACHGLVLHAGS